MKVRAASFVVAAALALSMSACSNDTGTTPTGGTTSTNTAVTEVTLSVWSPQEDQSGADSWLKKQEAAFAAAHPEYKITWKESVVGEDKAADTVKQDPSAAADVYMFSNDQLGGLIEANAIGLLPPASQAQVKEQNTETMINSVTGTDGQLYGVPYTANTWFLYYDKSKFTEDDIKSLDTMLTKGKVAFELGNGWYNAAPFVGNGATFFGPTQNDQAAGIKLGSGAADVTTALVALSKNPNFVIDDGSAGLAGIQNGTINAYFSGSWSAAQVKEALGDNLGAAQPPTLKVAGKDVQITAFAGSKAAGFNPNAKNATAAAQFAAFLGSPEAQKDHYTMRGVIPSDKTLAADAAVAADPVAVAQMSTVDNASILQPTVTKMNDWWAPAEIFGKGIQSGDVTEANAAAKTEAFQATFGA